MNKGGRPKGIPNKVTPTVAEMILQDEGREEEGGDDRQGVEPVEADGVRGTTAGMSREALQSCAETTRHAKSWGPVP